MTRKGVLWLVLVAYHGARDRGDRREISDMSRNGQGLITSGTVPAWHAGLAQQVRIATKAMIGNHKC